jgi:hypothetical protein
MRRPAELNPAGFCVMRLCPCVPAQTAQGPNEREEIERLLEQIDTALNQLEEIGPDPPSDQA